MTNVFDFGKYAKKRSAIKIVERHAIGNVAALLGTTAQLELIKSQVIDDIANCENVRDYTALGIRHRIVSLAHTLFQDLIHPISVPASINVYDHETDNFVHCITVSLTSSERLVAEGVTMDTPCEEITSLSTLTLSVMMIEYESDRTPGNETPLNNLFFGTRQYPGIREHAIIKLVERVYDLVETNGGHSFVADDGVLAGIFPYSLKYSYVIMITGDLPFNSNLPQ